MQSLYKLQKQSRVDSASSTALLLPNQGTEAKEKPQKESKKLTEAREALSGFARGNTVRNIYAGTEYEYNDDCKELGLINALITRLGKENKSGSYTEEISNLTTKRQVIAERSNKYFEKNLRLNRPQKLEIPSELDKSESKKILKAREELAPFSKMEFTISARYGSSEYSRDLSHLRAIDNLISCLQKENADGKYDDELSKLNSKEQSIHTRADRYYRNHVERNINKDASLEKVDLRETLSAMESAMMKSFGKNSSLDVKNLKDITASARKGMIEGAVFSMLAIVDEEMKKQSAQPVYIGDVRKK